MRSLRSWGFLGDGLIAIVVIYVYMYVVLAWAILI